MCILITHPDFRDPGGVSGYYKHLKDKFNVPVQHFIIGSRPEEKGFIRRTSRMLHDYHRFIKCLKKEDVTIVQLSPSLDPKSMFRDTIFVLLTRIYKKKAVVFFFGWQKSFEAKIDKFYAGLFRLFYKRINTFIVQATEFRTKLKTWGFDQPVYIEAAVINDDTINGFDINKAITERQSAGRYRILFLARITKGKGIYEAIEAFSLLQNKYPDLELIVAGDGEELGDVKRFVRMRNRHNINFTGYVNGDEKRRLFESSHIYCFPTHHGEGMPGSVAEAMAFGLPVVTRPVGGISDFFKDGQHGFISTSSDPAVFANFIERLILDKELYRKISLHNYQHAQSNFLASRAVARLEQIYQDTMSMN